MHIIESHTGKFKRYLPADLSECDAQQYIDMCGLIFEYHTQKINANELLTHAVYRLMNMKPSKKITDADAENIAVNLVLIQELLQSTFFERINQDDNGNFDLKIVQNYIDNPVPRFKPLWRTYYGPSNAFQNVKCGEYVDALRIFQEFNANGDMNLLYDLAATLYRPKKRFHYLKSKAIDYDGDCRIPYNSHQIAKRAKAFKYAPIGFIYGVYLYFASMQIFISGAEVPWGDKVLDLSILFTPGESSVEIEAADIGLTAVLFAMAETGVFGDLDKMYQTPLWTMLIKMYDSRVKQLQQEKQQENANNQSTP